MLPRLLERSFRDENSAANFAGFVHNPAAGTAEKRDDQIRENIGEAIVKLRKLNDQGAPDKEPAGDAEEGSSKNNVDRGDDDAPKVLVSEFVKLPIDQLKKTLQEKDVLLFFGSSKFNEAKSLEALKGEFDQFLRRGGTLVLDRHSAPLFGTHYQSETPNFKVNLNRDGLNVVPECSLAIVDDVKDAVFTHVKPKTFGVLIETGSILRLRGRKFDLVAGRAMFGLRGESKVVEQLKTRRDAGRNFQSATFDLTQWRRMAIDATLDAFPPAKPPTPYVADGTLIIVGGGGMPRGLMSQMVEMAGGKDAKMVYVPCSENEDVGTRHGMVAQWKRMGVKSATFIHTKDRNVANDESFYEPLKDATGVWFGGGRQWNFADSYYGTKTHEMMKKILERGGVIGGSSAGASIQGRFLARATPVGNTRILAPGYERGGLGFIGGVAIDQHFSQRGRQKNMTQLVTKYPQLLGIGLDEATAIIVNKSEAKVVGRGRVFFYDQRTKDGQANVSEKDYSALAKGGVYDLAKRKVVKEGVIEKKETD